MTRLKLAAFFSAALITLTGAAADPAILLATSPDQNIRVTLTPEKALSVERRINDKTDVVFPSIRLGLETDQGKFDIPKMSMQMPRTAPTRIQETYTRIVGKRSICRVSMNEQSVLFRDGDRVVRLVVRVGNDSFAFRYEIDTPCAIPITFTRELTAFTLPHDSKRWLQHRSTWYEGRYEAASVPDTRRALWSYPILFHTKDKATWCLVSETGYDGPSYCGTILSNQENADVFNVLFPEAKEGEGFGYTTPTAPTPWKSPWRAAVIGGLNNVVESTLYDDLAPESVLKDTSWIQPGIVSWIYWAYNHGSRDFKVVKDYIDLAVEMHWPNVLIDWEWDIMDNGGNIDDALAYAREKNINVWLWYNSGGKHNWGGGGPRDRLLTHELRVKEFTWLAKNGVKGIKVDFFGSDKQSMYQYHFDILKDAADFKIMVNFHGAPIPRGWARTYPNLLSMEAVYGEEWYNNRGDMTHFGAQHNTTLPFTRNVVGSMDYTPTAFTNSQNPHTTSYAHELALAVLFESGAQSMADRPSGFRTLPDQIKSFLSTLPAAWDDTKYLGGEPDQYVILARCKGNVWYVGGINGTNEPMNFSFTVPGRNGRKFKAAKFEDGKDVKSFAISNGSAAAGDVITGTMLGRGGFAMEFRAE